LDGNLLYLGAPSVHLNSRSIDIIAPSFGDRERSD
jgi:hypothetical protein